MRIRPVMAARRRLATPEARARVRLVFTKGAGRYDRLEVIRPDGDVLAIDQPKQRILPHDMMHALVEAELEGGFIDAVAGGADVAFARGSWSERAEAFERLVEALQAAAWSGGTSPADIIALYEVACGARGHAVWPLDAVIVERLVARVADAQAQWDALPAGGSIEFEHAVRAAGPLP